MGFVDSCETSDMGRWPNVGGCVDQTKAFLDASRVLSPEGYWGHVVSYTVVINTKWERGTRPRWQAYTGSVPTPTSPMAAATPRYHFCAGATALLLLLVLVPPQRTMGTGAHHPRLSPYNEPTTGTTLKHWILHIFTTPRQGPVGQWSIGSTWCVTYWKVLV
jgi:hypothetical protein